LTDTSITSKNTKPTQILIRGDHGSETRRKGNRNLGGTSDLEQLRDYGDVQHTDEERTHHQGATGGRTDPPENGALIMCGRFTSLLSPELLAVIREIFGVPVPEAVEPRYNIAPTQLVRVLRNEGDHNRFDLMKWGLVPFWAKDPSIGSQMINARSETVREKPAFRQAIKYRRCIIPSSGF
jgi:hypothetical protein